MPSGDLHNYISSTGPIDERQSARYIRHILEGLEYLHNKNILLINIAVSEHHHHYCYYYYCYCCCCCCCYCYSRITWFLVLGRKRLRLLISLIQSFFTQTHNWRLYPNRLTTYVCGHVVMCFYLFYLFKLAPEALQCSPLTLSTDLWSVGAVALFM